MNGRYFELFNFKFQIVILNSIYSSTTGYDMILLYDIDDK